MQSLPILKGDLNLHYNGDSLMIKTGSFYEHFVLFDRKNSIVAVRSGAKFIVENSENFYNSMKTLIPLVKCVPLTKYEPLESFFVQTKDDVNKIFLLFYQGKDTFYKLGDFSCYEVISIWSPDDHITLVGNVNPSLRFSFSLALEENKLFFEQLTKVYNFYRILTEDQEPTIELGNDGRSLVHYHGQNMHLDEFSNLLKTNQVLLRKDGVTSSPLYVYRCFMNLLSYDISKGLKSFYFGNNHEAAFNEKDVPKNLKDVMGTDFV